MTPTTRRLSAAAAGAALVLALAACAPTPEPTEPAAPAGPVTLDFWFSATGAASDTLLSLVDEYNASNDDEITINPVFQGTYDESMAKLTNAVQSGDVPALIQGGDTYTSYLRDTGLTTSPEDQVDRAGESLDPDSLVPVAANYYSLDGKLLAVPILISQPLFFFNPTLLEQAGLDAAKTPKDIDGVFAWAKTIYEKTGVPGLTFQANSWWNEQFAGAAGLVYCTPGNGVGADAATEFDFVNDELVDLWTTYQSLVASGAILNVGTDGVAAQNAFSSGGSGILLGSSGVLGTISAAAAFDIGAFGIPVTSDKGGVVPGGSALWILGEGKSDDERSGALSFANFLISAESQKRTFSESGFLPSSKAALEALQASDITEAQKVTLEQLAGTRNTVAGSGCHSGAFGVSRPKVTDAISAIASGSDVREALTQAQEFGNQELAKYNERIGN